MNVKRILCPVDFSDFSNAANQYASMLAASNGATIVYLHVALPEVPYGTYAYVDMDYDQARDQEQLEKIKPTADGIETQYVVEFGPPADRIVEYALENDIDLIVMGTHGRTGLKRAILGSVAEQVVRKADCPVLALKTPNPVPQTN